MDVESGSVWSFAAVMGTAALGQAVLAWRAHKKGREKRVEDFDVSLENKDSRAFKFLVERLEKSEANHLSCEARADQQQLEINRLGRLFDLAQWSIAMLREQLVQAGMKVPILPPMENKLT